MISQSVQNYIRENSFCPECLFKNWESFLDLLYAEGGRVSAILWWDYCDASQHLVSVGSGGYRDPDNEGYVYAETPFYKNGLEEKTLDEIKEYIDRERNAGFQYDDKYRSHHLVPAFYLVE